MEIIRTKTRASGGITPEEEIKLKAHAELWIERAMRTTPIEKDKITLAIEGLYNVSGLKKPRIVIVPSPLVMVLAGGIASAVWYLRKNTATRNATYDATHNETDAAMRNATYDATQVAMYDETHNAMRNATHNETDAAMRNATYDATHNETYDTTRKATETATYDATRAATRAATDDATDAATYDATRNTTRNATDAATYDATRNITKNATIAATYDATENATQVETRAATRNTTYDVTRDATRNVTRDVTRNATYAATRNTTRNATRDATRAATRNTTRAATDDAWVYEVCKEFVGEKNVAFAFSCIQSVMNIYQGGNMWADYECYLTAPRDVLGLELPIYEKYKFWEQAAVHGGFRIMQDEFCLVSDFPEILLKSQQNQAHCETGPSHRWRDGWELYHLNGVRFEKELWGKIVNKKLSFKEIMQIKDIDKQAIAMKYMLATDFLKSVKAELVCEKTAKGNELWKVPIEPSKVFDRDEYFLHYFCPSSGREYLQAVEHDKAIESKFNADYLMALRHKFLLSEYLSSDFISV